MKTHRTLIRGPIIDGKRSYAFIDVFPHRVSSTVYWNIGSIDNSGPLSTAFSKYCTASGLFEALHSLRSRHHFSSPSGFIQPGVRWGHAIKLKNEFVKPLRDILFSHWSAAVQHISSLKT